MTCRVHMWRVSWMCDMTHPYAIRLTHMCRCTWLIYTWYDSSICDMTHSCVPWLRRVTAQMMSCMWHDEFICDMMHSYATRLTYMCHDSDEQQLKWGVVCDMTHSYVTWRIHMRYDSLICAMTMCHDSDGQQLRRWLEVDEWGSTCSRASTKPRPHLPQTCRPRFSAPQVRHACQKRPTKETYTYQ